MRKIKFIKGEIYHIFNRGIEKRNIFQNNSDKWRFLQAMFLFNNKDVSFNALHQIERDHKGQINFTLLKEFVANQQKDRIPLVRVMADCLMPNHYHLLVQEICEDGISRFMHRLGTGYTNFFNKKYDRVGSLFQGPFKAALIDNDIYLKYLLIYINLINPAQLTEPELKEKGIIDIEKVMDFAKNYQWSTHPDYLNKRESIIIEKGIFKDFFSDSDIYRKFAKDVLVSKHYNILEHLMLD